MSFGQLVTVVLLGRVVAGSVLAGCFGNMQKNRDLGAQDFYVLLYKVYLEPKGL